MIARVTPFHASIDRGQRLRKAGKIIRIVEEARPIEGLQVLEVGTGSGVIANAIARSLGPAGALSSVDVRDERIEPFSGASQVSPAAAVDRVSGMLPTLVYLLSKS